MHGLADPLGGIRRHLVGVRRGTIEGHGHLRDGVVHAVATNPGVGAKEFFESVRLLVIQAEQGSV